MQCTMHRTHLEAETFNYPEGCGMIGLQNSRENGERSG